MSTVCSYCGRPKEYNEGIAIERGSLFGSYHMDCYKKLMNETKTTRRR
jgi:hypothetical protein